MSEPIFEIMGDDGQPIFTYKARTILNSESDIVHRYDELKFVRITAGEALWQVGSKTYSVGPGDFMIFGSADLRRIKQISAPLTIAQFTFLPAAVYPRQSCTACFYNRTPDFSNKLSAPPLEQGFCAILEEIYSARPYREAAILTELTRMVIAAARQYAQTDATVSLSHTHDIDRALAFIRSHISDPTLRLEQAAAAAGLSPAYFSRLFKTHIGTSFQNYVARLRVTKVVEQLQEGTVNVLEAALAAGFSGSSGFYRTFRAVTGSTPKAFCKK